MLSYVDGNLLSLLLVGIHKNPLNEIVAVLIASNIDERNSWSLGMSCGNHIQIPIEKLNSANLEAFLDHLRGILVDAVAVSIDEDVVNDTSFVRWSTVLTEMLDAPVAKLSVSNEINVGNDFLNGRSFLLLDAILENVLDNQAACFTKSNFVPHAS